MNIAIITLPLHTNYGGILQAYALQTTLTRLGHSVVLFEPKPQRIHHPFKMPLVYLKRGLCKYILHQDIEVFRSPQQRIRKYTDIFIKRHLHIKLIKDWNSTLSKKYDAFIVGSDQIWRPRYCYSLRHAFLDFTQGINTKRIAYAASFGIDTNEFTEEQISLCKPLAQKFDYISTREDSGIKLCKDLFDVPAVQMIDPTLLLAKGDYVNLIQGTSTPASNGNLLVYILDEKPETESQLTSLAKQKNLTPFRANSKVEQYDAPISERIQPPVEHWLRGFQDAEFVITDSFHACVFSILFHKPFICIGNKDRGMSRFTSLLRMFHLEDRLVSSLEDFTDTPINWEEVDAILTTKRAEAMEFLTTALNPMG